MAGAHPDAQKLARGVGRLCGRSVSAGHDQGPCPALNRITRRRKTSRRSPNMSRSRAANCALPAQEWRTGRPVVRRVDLDPALWPPPGRVVPRGRRSSPWPSVTASARATPPRAPGSSSRAWVLPKGTRVLISLWYSLMFGRYQVPAPSISESHSEISTRVPFCIAAAHSDDERRETSRDETKRRRAEWRLSFF